MRRGGAVGRLGNDAGLHGFGVVQSDDVFERRGNQDVALHGQQLVIADARRAGHTDNCPRTLLVADGFDGIDAAGICHPAASVTQSNDFRFLLSEQARGSGASIAETLNGNGRATQRNLLHLARFFDDVEQAAGGGLAAALRTPDRNGFAGDDAMGGMADGHGIGVHDPGHGLRVGVNIRRGNVHGRSDDRQNFAGVTARHAFELTLGHALGIANHAALGASEGHVDGGGFPGHPSRQRFYFIERDVGVIADAALAWPARHVVLHAEAGKHLNLAIVHLRRQGNFQHALGSAQNLPQAGIELQEFRCHVELNLRDAKRIQVLAGSDAGHHGRCTDLSCRGCGLCDRGHRRRSFRLLDLSKKFCLHLAQVQNPFW